MSSISTLQLTHTHVPQAGSGEFHVYKQNRRREYERLKIMDEKALAVRLRPLLLSPFPRRR